MPVWSQIFSLRILYYGQDYRLRFIYFKHDYNIVLLKLAPTLVFPNQSHIIMSVAELYM